jgi:mono/diheme cytochrome c family protein
MLRPSRSRPLSWPVSLALAIGAIAGASSAGCGRGAGSAPEWTPADHHSTDDDKAQAAAQPSAPAASGSRGAKGDDASQLVELAWRQQCATCHGASGKGDGPMGPMIQAPDLTSSAWQTKASDAEITAIIQTGKNKMPRFDLPDVVVRGLVARIRSLKGS